MPRSDPLILDKETREPLPECLPFTANKYEPWKVVVLDTDTGQRRFRKFFSYQVAKKAVEHLKAENPGLMIGVVSRQKGYGPPYSKITDEQLLAQNELGNYWCPYCLAFRRFLHSFWRGKRLCELCAMPSSDFHVIKCNPILWPHRIGE